MLLVLDWGDFASPQCIPSDRWMGVTGVCIIVSDSVRGVWEGCGGDARLFALVLFHGVVGVVKGGGMLL